MLFGGLSEPFDISIHALREEGDKKGQGGKNETQIISIHALREEGDTPKPARCTEQVHFYPRPPRGGRRAVTEAGKSTTTISIHALREEGDAAQLFQIFDIREFLSTPSARRATHGPASFSPMNRLFLSTPSARRATYLKRNCI